MAGYNLVVKASDGALISKDNLHTAYAQDFGDRAYDTVEELYGMIWVLACATHNSGITTASPAALVKWAQDNYKDGLEAEVDRKLEG